MIFLEGVAYEKTKIESRCGSQNEPWCFSLIQGISKIFRKVCPQKMESSKVGNLPLEFSVQVRVSAWEVLVRPQPKRLSHGLIQVLHGGVRWKECFLGCDLEALLLLL